MPDSGAGSTRVQIGTLDLTALAVAAHAAG
jgi:hypothetical protein